MLRANHHRRARSRHGVDDQGVRGEDGRRDGGRRHRRRPHRGRVAHLPRQLRGGGERRENRRAERGARGRAGFHGRARRPGAAFDGFEMSAGVGGRRHANALVGRAEPQRGRRERIRARERGVRLAAHAHGVRRR